jgi:hypothetical protein
MDQSHRYGLEDASDGDDDIDIWDVSDDETPVRPQSSTAQDLIISYPLQYQPDWQTGSTLPHHEIYRDRTLPICNDEGPYFRLLRIKPGSPDDVIQCILESRPMYEGLSSYKALSYSWGDEPFSETIYIGRNSLPFSVSPHVAAALRHLRDPCRAVHVWIDAICINQGDLLEKSQQLSIMASIYNQAEQVVIWLGGNGDSNNQSLEDEEVIWSMCQQSHAWWNRLWVVQECVYAERCPIVMLGDHTMSLDSWIQTWTAVIQRIEKRSEDSRKRRLRKHCEFWCAPHNAWMLQDKDNPDLHNALRKYLTEVDFPYNTWTTQDKGGSDLLKVLEKHLCDFDLLCNVAEGTAEADMIARLMTYLNTSNLTPTEHLDNRFTDWLQSTADFLTELHYFLKEQAPNIVQSSSHSEAVSQPYERGSEHFRPLAGLFWGFKHTHAMKTVRDYFLLSRQSYRSWRTRDGDSLNRTKILQDNLVFLRMPYDAWKMHTEDNIQRLPLLLRLRQTAERQCKVPHDRIYAILSIVDHREARWIPPDYRKSYSTLRTEVNKILRSSPQWDEKNDRHLLGTEPDQEGVSSTTTESPQTYPLLWVVWKAPFFQRLRGNATLAISMSINTVRLWVRHLHDWRGGQTKS